MKRPQIKLILAAALLATSTLSAVGCVSLAANLMRMVNGNETKPEFEGLKNQKLVIVCSDEMGYCHSDATNHITRGIQSIVTNKLRKVEVIPQSKIDNWLANDSEGADVAPQIGRALNADMVILVDVRGLTLHDGATMFRGKCDLTVDIFDVKQDKVIFRRNLPGYTYPQNAAISRTEMDDAKFQRMYLSMAAERVSQLFVPSPMGSDVAIDAHILAH